ncbi:MAG TPA: CRTAC1 family protein [Pseudomonadales bacterium]|nr:CRTAC1 family protein [Pseudomonadales bacterium]HND27432.1 CRTAC1 family protein [Pseudomonadales bacterium]
MDRKKRLSLWVAVAMLAAGCSEQRRAPLFEEVTEAAGLAAYVGMTHGVAWGDFDGDDRPDLYVTNHLDAPLLFRNLGNGKFAEVTQSQFDAADLAGDKHGALWADFNNDGQLDLVQLTGAQQGVGAEPKRLFMNQNGRFTEVAARVGVDNPQGRTRMPLWVDLDRDGRLDLFQGAEARFDALTPPFLFMQQDGRFDAAAQPLPFASRSVPFCLLTELTQDAHPELLCRVVGKNKTAQLFDLASLPARELDLLPVTAFEDAAAGDFDNDGAIDLLLARKNPAGALALGQPAANLLIADLWVTAADVGKPLGFSFKASGQLDVQVRAAYAAQGLGAQQIHIGRQGEHPAGVDFALPGEMADVDGVAPHQSGEQAALYLGRQSTDRWQIEFSAATAAAAAHKPQQITVMVRAATAITELTPTAEATRNEQAPQRLFMNQQGKLVEQGDKRGVNEVPISAVNVVAGDFDNDMHLDLFLLGSGDVGMQQNLLLRNRGDGRFEAVPQAGGAQGSMAGVGDSVTTVDHDGDGFLDLLIASGGSMGRSLGLPSAGGGYRLYHNVRNGNHWIEIDLEGTRSNRDGIGARVEVTAGGVTQTRLQDGGVHERSQNHSRLHFGLGPNSQIDRLTIHWPSGVVQQLSGVAADQLLRVQEAAQ